MKSPSNSSLVIGSAVHLAISRELKGESRGNYFAEAKKDHEEKSGSIEWKESEDTARKHAAKHVDNYMNGIGRHLDVISTEQEILLEIPGVDIPILGYVDVETANRGIVDLKSTKYFRRQPELNPEWKLQMNIYQIEYPESGEFHILTRSRDFPVVTPTSRDDPLYVPAPDPQKTLAFVAQEYSVMEHYYEEWGADVDWPGNRTHPWAARYCTIEQCCQKY